MKKYAILTYMARGMSWGTAPNETSSARLNEGKYNSSFLGTDKLVKDLIRDENGNPIKFMTQVEALNYCVSLGWQLEQTIFDSHEGFNSRDPISNFIFILSKNE